MLRYQNVCFGRKVRNLCCYKAARAPVKFPSGMNSVTMHRSGGDVLAPMNCTMLGWSSKLKLVGWLARVGLSRAVPHNNDLTPEFFEHFVISSQCCVWILEDEIGDSIPLHRN
jgi:hypothetical protein